MIRQQLIEQLTREIMNYDAEYRRKTRQVELGLTHGTEKEGRADWHLAILTLPPAWTGGGGLVQNPTQAGVRLAFSAVDLSQCIRT